MISIFLGDRAYSSGRRKLAIDGKELESKSHMLRVRSVRRSTLLSTFPFSINAYTHSLERSARTRFQSGELTSLTSFPHRGKHSGVLDRHVPLAKYVIKLFHRAVSSVVHFSTRCAPVETFVRGVTSAPAFLAGQAFPSSSVIMSFGSTMSARFVPSCTIVITLTITRS